MDRNNKPDTSDLNDPDKYQLLKKLDHSEVVHFVIGQLKKFRWPILIFYGFNLILLLSIITYSANYFFNPIFSTGNYFIYLFIGILSGMFLVIPFHEGLHGLAYRLAGAKRVKYGMDLKQMLFYASAPGFVTGKKEFIFIAFLPFFFINTVFVLGSLFGNPPFQWASLVALFVHSTLCIGDFAMVNFFAAYPGYELYTYDEDKTKTSYFYRVKKAA